MPFIDPHKLLFVHIPKCGGTSIENKFNLLHHHNLHVAYSYKIQEVGDVHLAPQHFTPKYLKLFYSERFNAYKKFVVVRNPYTKCISSFFYATIKENCNEQFFKDQFHNWCEKYYLVDRVDLTQSEYFEDVTYDFVLRQETLNEDFKQMANALGFSEDLLCLNKTKCTTSTTSCITLIEPRTIDFINTHFKKDFELLKYDMLPGIITGI